MLPRPLLHALMAVQRVQLIGSSGVLRRPLRTHCDLMSEPADKLSVADILGPWIEPDLNSGLIQRCRKAWNRPLKDLTREELATLLRQEIAVEHVLPEAKRRLQDGIDDDSELYDGELEAAIKSASKGR